MSGHGATPDSMRPLGSYVAKRCPRRVQLDIVQPVEQVPAADDVVMRMEAGIAFEVEITGRLQAHARPDWVFIAGGPAADEIASTLAAIEAKAPLIVNARLPSDFEEWRSGAPDLMVWDVDGYVPIDVKHHKTFDDGEGIRVSDLAEPTPAASNAVGFDLRARKDDTLQLAHYRRMLQGLDLASSGSVGGIIGKEGVVAWYDLDEARWTTPAKSDGKRRKRRTSMEVYDFEFGIRREWAEDAYRHLDDRAQEQIGRASCRERV